MSPKKCHQYGSPSITFGDSSVDRNSIRLGNYKGHPIAVGGWYSRSAEVMSLKSDFNWSPIAEFPCDGQNCNRLDSKYDEIVYIHSKLNIFKWFILVCISVNSELVHYHWWN